MQAMSKNQLRKLRRREKGKLRAALAEATKWKDMFCASNKSLIYYINRAQNASAEVRKFQKGLLTNEGLHLPKWVNPPCPIYFKMEDQDYSHEPGNGLIVMPGGMVG
jgi:hypothetical protein